MSYYDWSNHFREILGERIESVELSADKESLVLHLQNGKDATFTTDGDCCSSTWVEHLTVPGGIKGARITGYKDSGTVDSFNDPYHDVVQVYSTAIITTAGEIIVEYRNSSNGYYGGSLEGPYLRDRVAA